MSPSSLYLVPNIGVGEKGAYVAIVSYNSFFYGMKKRNWRPSHQKSPKYTRLYVAHRPDEIFDNTVTPGVPHEEVSTLWDFYKLIGYDHKAQKYQ